MKRTTNLLLRFVGWFFLVNSVIFWVVGGNYLSSNLLSTTLFHNSIVNYTSWTGKILVVFFTLVSFFSYLMLLSFIPAILIMLTTLIFPKKRLILAISILFATLSVAFFVLDKQIYDMYKFHLNTSLLNFIFSKQLCDILDLSHFEQLLIAGCIGFILIIECLIAYFVWQKIILPRRFLIGKTIGGCWLGSIILTYFILMLSVTHLNNLFIQQAANLPLLNEMLAFLMPEKNSKEILQGYSEQHYMQAHFSNDTLNYPRHSMHCQAQKTTMLPLTSHKPYNIILIMVDSLRYDSLQFMPNVSRFGRENWQFLNHQSGGNSTQAGLFSLFYSIPSTYWTAALNQKKSPVFLDILQKSGYKMRIQYSAEMRNPPLNKTIFQNVPNIPIDGAPGSNVADWDRHTTREAISFLSSNSAQQPFFLNLFYNAPHAFCRKQTIPTLFKPVAENCSRVLFSNQTDPAPYYNRYLNTVAFIDKEIAKVLKIIHERGYLDNSIVIFTSDHGQEFNDNHQNYWGHCSNFSSYQVHVPFIVHWPNEPARTIHYVTSGYDVVPTLLSRVFSCENPFSDYSVGQDLLIEKNHSSFILAGSYVNACVIEKDRLTTLHTSGQMSITDLKLNPIPDAALRHPILKQALRGMRMFYE